MITQLTSRWKQNRTLQFAVGLSVIMLAAKWLWTGQLLATYDALAPPDDGGTKTVSAVAVLGPMVVEGVCWIGAAVIGWASGFWAKLANLSAKAITTRTSKPPAAVLPDISIQMARAAALGDTSEVNRLRALHRRPYLLRELIAAYESEDLDTADKLTRELNSLLGRRKPAVAKTSTRSRRKR